MPGQQHVRFRNPAYTVVVFPLNHPEYWTIRYFEDHVRRCSLCAAPFQRMCMTGLCHARAVDSYMYYQDGHIKSATSERLLLHVPAEFVGVRSLLETLQHHSPVEITQSSSAQARSSSVKRRYQSTKRDARPRSSVRYFYYP